MRYSVFLLAFCQVISLQAQVPAVAGGTLHRHASFPSRYVAPRNVDVWLPTGYSPAKRYAVLYMHDGQMLFDSTTTWNHSEWGVDETMTRLLATNQIGDCIVVGIWNVPSQRFADYFPQKVLATVPEPTRTTILTKQLQGPPTADNYLKFMVTELKPFIDSTYATRPDVAHTFILGSSMGGLISAYALCEYPTIFGGAACLSTHSPLIAYELIDAQTDANVASKFRAYLAAHLPKANTRKLYFDYGDQTGDAFYKPYQTAIDGVLKRKGYTAPYWQTRYFPGEDHSEHAWAKRLAIPVLFLLN